MNSHRFTFIICYNDKRYLEECLFYIGKLHIPEGYEVDILSILEAKSMTSGYNEGMNATDARYKIYLHQDVFILNMNFFGDLLSIFQADEKIGMIGMVGALTMPWDGVMWNGYRVGALYGSTEVAKSYDQYRYSVEDGYDVVAAVDGLLIATCVDIPWREDLLDGWDFYDVSQSLEMRKRGYEVVVPVQKNPWCFHDDGILSMLNYNKYRKICMQEYAEFYGR